MDLSLHDALIRIHSICTTAFHRFVSSHPFSLAILYIQSCTIIQRRVTTTTLLHATPNNIPNDLPLVPLATIAALILLITAQSFINFLLKGDRGLGAFLSDGSGYNKSGFRRTNNSDDRMETDPLPWLKLPMFDYVDVAGQKKEQMMVAGSTDEEIVLLRRMEEMKDQIRERIDEGKYDSARKIELELELLMKAEGYEFKKSFE
jgi:hypothetical protein